MSVYNPVHAHKKQFLWWRDTEIPKRNMNIWLLWRLWHPHLRDLHFIISFPAETFFLQLNKSLLLFFLLCVSVSCLSPSASSSSLYPEPRNACLCANTGAAIGSTLSLVFSAVIKQCSSVWARECLCKTERQKQKKKVRERERVWRHRLFCDLDLMWTLRSVVLGAADGDFTHHASVGKKKTRGHASKHAFTSTTSHLHHSVNSILINAFLIICALNEPVN